ncbi:excisionase family DNA-binding protein [Limnohabitans sp.]|uniref:excisionase family DNA-binding protein n=1 Tax=Limnohabitans sp. TaxID=1907725 RepID=UPI00286F2A92|nr:excisionase family DNA-binding protein [Limnohabitans sp.]
MKAINYVLNDATCGTSQAAKLLQVSVGTIHHMIERGELDAWLTVGGHRRIPLDSIRNCQIRRRMHISAQPENIKILVLADDFELFTKLKWMLSPLNNEEVVNVNFFSDPIKMMLDLDSIAPRLVVLDKSSLALLGGFSWFSQFREKNKYKHTQILLIGDVSEPSEMSTVLIFNVDTISKSFEDSWLKGYVSAVLTSGKLLCQ